jgi:epoxyqueuosine reductase QueG
MVCLMSVSNHEHLAGTQVLSPISLVNEFGTPVSYHRCQTCGQAFTTCPATSLGNSHWDHCLADLCLSYDPNRDPFNPLLGGIDTDEVTP